MNLNTKLVQACRFDYGVKLNEMLTLEEWILYAADLYKLRVDTQEEADLVVGLAILEGKAGNYLSRIIVGPLPRFSTNVLEVSRFT